MSAETMQDIVRQIRGRVKDRPPRTRVADAAGINASVQTITLPLGAAGYFPQSGRFFEFDDATGERCYAEDAAVGGDTVDTLSNVQRGVDGTTPAAHALGTPILIEPRWWYSDIAEQVNRIIDNELWPQSWVPGKSTLAWQGSNDYYPAPVAGIEDIVCAYQLVSGTKFNLHAELLPAVLADDTNFPLGAITIRMAPDSSTIYIAYRARATLATLTSAQKHLVITGALAQQLIAEEATHVAPASSYIDRRVADGSKARSGQLLWQQFKDALYGDWLDLTSDEDKLKRQLRTAGR